MIFLTRAEWKSDCGRKHLGIGYIQGVCVCSLTCECVHHLCTHVFSFALKDAMGRAVRM